LCCIFFRHLFLSINRFEKKKNIALAISAFALLMRQQENSVPERMNVRLAVAGVGYWCFLVWPALIGK
jgi:glycosyltransferase involved in cell wall biosynthesis